MDLRSTKRALDGLLILLIDGVQSSVSMGSLNSLRQSLSGRSHPSSSFRLTTSSASSPIWKLRASARSRGSSGSSFCRLLSIDPKISMSSDFSRDLLSFLAKRVQGSELRTGANYPKVLNKDWNCLEAFFMPSDSCSRFWQTVLSIS